MGTHRSCCTEGLKYYTMKATPGNNCQDAEIGWSQNFRTILATQLEEGREGVNGDEYKMM